MALRPHFSPSLISQCNLFDPWDHPDLPPISLKQLGQNLNFLERQYHIRSKSSPKISNITKIKANFYTISINKNNEKENRDLSSVPSLQITDLLRRKNKRSISAIKEMKPYPIKQNQSLCTERKKAGKDFWRMRGLFPLQGKGDSPFLSKNRLMTISKVVNMNRRRDNTCNKISATVCRQDLQKNEDQQVLFVKSQRSKVL